MFNKVLVVEDHESVNISVQKCLSDLEIRQAPMHNVYYCDDALQRIKRAIAEKDPYQLMITDLSFDPDGSIQQLKSGPELIMAARAIQPDLKILVFSIENRYEKVKQLFLNYKINAFVPKARQDAKDLKAAIESVYLGKDYYSPNLKRDMASDLTFSFTPYDRFLLSLLASGKKQIEFPEFLEKHGFKPYSLSSIEKRLKNMRDSLNVSTNEQLLTKSMEIGVI